MADLSSVWGHSVHFAKFHMLRFSKGFLMLLTQFSNMVVRGGIQAITFFSECQI